MSEEWSMASNACSAVRQRPSKSKPIVRNLDRKGRFHATPTPVRHSPPCARRRRGRRHRLGYDRPQFSAVTMISLRSRFQNPEIVVATGWECDGYFSSGGLLAALTLGRIAGETAARLAEPS